MLGRVTLVMVLLGATSCATVHGWRPKPPRFTVPAGAGQAAPAPDDGTPSVSAPVAEPEPPVFDELRCIRAPEIDAWERNLRRHRLQWQRMVESGKRGGAHRPTVQRLVADADMPPGLALLPAIESGYRRHATGPRGSRGLWQIGRSTARRYGLVVRGRRDDRLDVERSTRVALRILRDHHHRFGSWPLALAAYNAGPARVRRALRGRRGASFWALAKARRLPPITRKYVPKFLALVRMLEPESVCPPRSRAVVATAE